MKLDELKRIAEAATKVTEMSPTRVAFDNTFTPAIALALIARVETLETRIEKLEGALRSLVDYQFSTDDLTGKLVQVHCAEALGDS